MTNAETAVADANATLAAAEAYCRRLAKSHYENFALVSVFIPRRLHQHVYNVYAFARTADDFADEGPDPRENLRKLEDWEQQLAECYRGRAVHPVFVALRHTLQEFAIPEELFRRLLIAFKQDQQKARYATFDELLDYCRNSANPVGRIYLHLFGLATPERCALSDQICTALQLTNFWQDVRRDLERGRIYLPEEDLRRFNVSEEDLSRPRASAAVKALIRFEVERTREFFRNGKRLENQVPRSLGRQIRLFVQGGEAVLAAIERQGYDVLGKRPVLSRLKKTQLLLNVLRS